MRRLVAACLAALLLAGCSAATAPEPDVLVTGDPGSRPTLTYVTPLAVSKTVHKVVWQGAGSPLVDGEPVLVDFWLEDASDATVVKESYSSSPTPRPLTVEDLGGNTLLERYHAAFHTDHIRHIGDTPPHLHGGEPSAT